MGPCKGIYTLLDRRAEVGDFFLERKGVKSQTKKNSVWSIVINNYVYQVNYIKADIDVINSELKKLEYEMIAMDIYSLSICSPSKDAECIKNTDELYLEIVLYLKSKGVEIIT
jgi:hypothetical protein